MAALALMGTLIGALGAITGQWLPAWRYGFGRLQPLETLDVGLERLTQDLATARWVTVRSRVGDTIAGWTLRSISTRAVALETDGRTLALELHVVDGAAAVATPPPNTKGANDVADPTGASGKPRGEFSCAACADHKMRIEGEKAAPV